MFCEIKSTVFKIKVLACLLQCRSFGNATLQLFSLYNWIKSNSKVTTFEILQCFVQKSSNPQVNFELTSQFLFKFSIILYCLDTSS